MKQIIILIAMIILGLFIAGLVLGFQEDAQELADNSKAGIAELTEAAGQSGIGAGGD